MAGLSEEKEVKQEKKFDERVIEVVEEKAKKLMESGIQVGNIDYFSKLIDIHKDIKNESYWNEKEEVMKMRYNDYSDGGYGRGNYGRRGVPGTGRGRYRGNYSPSRSNYPAGRYGAGEAMETAIEHYGAYSESKDAANMGNYGAEQDSMKSLEYMLKSVCQFMEMLVDESDSEEEIQLIKSYAKKISEL